MQTRRPLWVIYSMIIITVYHGPSIFSLAKSLNKRQAGLNDLINSALALVKPLVDTSRQMADTMLTETAASSRTSSVRTSAMSHRDSDILGASRYSSLDQVPICRANSQICKFISCAAANFKNDQSLSNLNLAAQVIGDTRLRKAVSSDPDALKTVCLEQGMNTGQCKVFMQGFRLIDDFITRIEDDQQAQHGQQHRPKNNEQITVDPYSDLINNNSQATRPRALGSTTWSTMSRQIPQMIPADIASFTDLLNLRPLTKLPFVSSVLPLDKLFDNDDQQQSDNTKKKNRVRRREDSFSTELFDNDDQQQRPLTKLPFVSSVVPLDKLFDNDDQQQSDNTKKKNRVRRREDTHRNELNDVDDDEGEQFRGQRVKRSDDYYDTVASEVPQDDNRQQHSNNSSTMRTKSSPPLQIAKQNCMALLG